MALSNTAIWSPALAVAIGCLPITTGRSEEPRKFAIVVKREKSQDGLLVGKVSVNGQAIGTSYENEEKQIPAGTYRGVLRYTSSKNFVQGPGGKLGKTGDFLIEVAGVPKRTDILFHAGNKPEHSEGCIMLGPATRDPKTGDPMAPEALKKLRLLFYDGVDSPPVTPDKAITIEVSDP